MAKEYTRSSEYGQGANHMLEKGILEAIDFDKALEDRDFSLDVLDRAEKRITIKPYITYDPKTNEIKTCHPELAELIQLVTNGNKELLKAIVTSKEGMRKAILRDQGAWLRTLMMAKAVDILLNSEKSGEQINAIKSVLAIMKSIEDGGNAAKFPDGGDDDQNLTLQQTRAAKAAGRQLLSMEEKGDTLPE